ncbi:hypothetical protein KKC91_00140 [bacterium]|nr:hypothetical protein [bacterium]
MEKELKNPSEWGANWIGYPGMRTKNNFYFITRKLFECPKRILKAKVSCTASSIYKLFINGKSVGFGPNPYLT